jgi:NodT family efflux transporter outer membrane factor (OMF) lipoprotein
MAIAPMLLAGCAVGPNYQQPSTATTLPKSFQQLQSPVERTQSDALVSASVAEFWREFNDDVLNQLVERALATNYDVQIAQSNLQEARAYGGFVEAGVFPSIGSSASATRRIQKQTTGSSTASRAARTGEIYDVGLDANWEINFFGRQSRALEGAKALISANEAGIYAAQVSVTAEVARNYLQLRGLQQQYALAQSLIDNQQQVLKLMQARLTAGTVTTAEVAAAELLLETIQANLPAFQSALSRTIYRLGVLTGQQATQSTWVADLVAQVKPMPGLSPINLQRMPIGTPAGLLQRRPDIRIAERQLAVATANIGYVKADLFPTVTMTGLLGLNAASIGLLKTGGAFYDSLGAGITWNVLDFGRIRSRIQRSEVQAETALLIYEKTVLLALEETESALATLDANQQQSLALYRALQQAHIALNTAQQRFKAGAVDRSVVLSAERQVLQSQDAFMQAQTISATALVSVYKALGGGWHNGQPS